MDTTGIVLIIIAVMVSITNGIAIFCNAKGGGTLEQQLLKMRIKMWKANIEDIAKNG